MVTDSQKKAKILSQPWEKLRNNFTIYAAESSDSRIGSSHVSGMGWRGGGAKINSIGRKSWGTDPYLSSPVPLGFPLPGRVWKSVHWRVLELGLPGPVEGVDTRLWGASGRWWRNTVKGGGQKEQEPCRWAHRPEDRCMRSGKGG